MSVLYGSLKGQGKTTATRRGSKSSGISCHIRGWDKGVMVWGYVDNQGEVHFEISRTGGSNEASSSERIATI